MVCYQVVTFSHKAIYIYIYMDPPNNIQVGRDGLKSAATRYYNSVGPGWLLRRVKSIAICQL